MRGKLFFGLMYSDKTRPHYEKTMAALEERFGKIIADSGVFDFTFTDSYLKEFGPNLKKIFVVFDKPIDRDSLAGIKNWSLPHQFDMRDKQTDKTIDSNRIINLDPGYITPNNVIVASTKDHPHRIYLGQGIFGDVQLILRKDSVATFPHTYPDYAANQKFFLDMRKLSPRD